MDGAQQSVTVSVSESPIDTDRMVSEVRLPESGATVLFLGTVRDHSPGKEGVTHLEYEVYEEMVEPKIREVVDEAASKWPLLKAAVAHRSGRVPVGEVSVAVAVATAHRADAFDAAEFIIDELKRGVPIWKKEFWPDGAEWSQGS